MEFVVDINKKLEFMVEIGQKRRSRMRLEKLRSGA